MLYPVGPPQPSSGTLVLEGFEAGELARRGGEIVAVRAGADERQASSALIVDADSGFAGLAPAAYRIGIPDRREAVVPDRLFEGLVTNGVREDLRNSFAGNPAVHGGEDARPLGCKRERCENARMRVHRGYRFRLYPTPAQEALLRQAVGVCRLVYNLALEQRRDHWPAFKRQTGRALSYTSQARELTALRAEVPWIRAVSQTMQQQALRDLDGAFQRFFRGEARYPRPRRRSENDGVRFMAREARVTKLNGTWSTVHVPNIGAVLFRTSRATIGRCLNVTVSRDALGWHVSFACEREIVPPLHMGPAVGVDAGIVHTMALSDGSFRDLPVECLNVLARQAKRAQRAVARGQRGSRRNAAAKAKVARIQAKAARARRHWQHVTTSAIARDFSTVVVEDLRVASMTASARGTAEEPGRNVRQKAGLNRSILAQGWSGSVTILSYKLPALGGEVVKEWAAYSSQTCRVCEHCAPENRESQAVFRCVACGHAENADTNAAGVVLGRYRRRGSTPAQDVEGKGISLPAKRQLDDVRPRV